MGDGVVAATALAVSLAALLAAELTAALFVVAVVIGAAALAGTAVASRTAGATRTAASGAASAIGITAMALGAVGLRAQQDLAGLAVPTPTSLDGVAELASDPVPSEYGTQVELIAHGRRYATTLPRRHEPAVLALRAGDRVSVDARVHPLRGAPPGWVRSRHLAGRLDVRAVEPAGGTRPWYRAANGIHELLERGAASMSSEHRALYLGLVVGDDRGQDDLTRFRFRASGLTHLLAVSGQNLVFVLAALSPLSSRLTMQWRSILAAAAIAGFVVVTRAEPSVLRAATMAVLGLSAAATGRSAPGVRLVALAVTALLLADPMLVHSVGFRLSVAATLGLVVMTRPITRWLPGPEWLARPLAVTLAAQLGAMPVMAVTFGAVSVLAIPANLVAEPAAGAVMTLGMSSGLVAGAVREELAWVLQTPIRAAVWWVDAVAASTARLSAPPVGAAGWSAVLGAGLLAGVIWRRGGARAMGRVVLVALLPWVVLLRPPMPDPGISTELTDAASAVAVCGRWEVELTDGHMGGQAVAEVLEALWRRGLTRVAVVRSSAAGGATAALARALGAVSVIDPGDPRAVGTPGDVPPPAARGSPCRLGP